MSATENEIMPTPHVFHRTEDGLGRWRPVLSHLRVTTLRDGGKMLRVGDGGMSADFVLSRQDAAHIASLLLES